MKIRLLVMDVDGTLTDGKVYIGFSGELLKAFNIKDGLGITIILPKLSIVPVIITGRKSKMLEIRCNELGIKELHQGISNKLALLNCIVSNYDCSLAEVAYIGDDINDLECMNAVANAGGLVGCPVDAAEEVQEVSSFISSHSGGEGAVRDFINWLVDTQK